MLLYILNTNFDRIAVADDIKSAIWTDRCREAGDFELVVLPSSDNIRNYRIDCYIENVESEHLMIIEKLRITSNTEDGDLVTVSGHSLEKILDRRVLWSDKTLVGPIQSKIKELITSEIIEPDVKERAIPNFVFEETDDPLITSLTLMKDCKRGDNLYDVIKEICEDYEINFKVTLNAQKQFVFKLYNGYDRSYAQKNNPYVVFSPGFENIISSDYTLSKENTKNVCLVSLTKSQPNGGKSEVLTAVAGESEGLVRRETYSDGSSVPEKDANDKTYPDEERKAMMAQIGSKSLGDYDDETIFDGEADAVGSFKYGRDFFLGDIVQVADAYGMGGGCLIKELIWSQESSGDKCYPTFEPKDTDEEGYLFYNGNQYRSVTGGWTIWDPEGAEFTVEYSSILKMESTGKNWNKAAAVIATANKVDLSGYSTLRCEIIGYGHIYVDPETQKPWENMLAHEYITNEVYQYSIDISGINKPCYICFGPWQKWSVEAYKIWLEK